MKSKLLRILFLLFVTCLSLSLAFACQKDKPGNNNSGSSGGSSSGNTQQSTPPDNGQDQGSSNGLAFAVSGDNSCTISGIGSCDEEELVIPETIDGRTVTTIGASAFQGQNNLRSVDVPETVTTIGESAFSECASLTYVILPDTITDIGDHAFSDCDSLEKIYYKGKHNAWRDITVGSDNDALSQATVFYYSEQAPTEEGNFWHYDENGEIVIWEYTLPTEEHTPYEYFFFTLLDDGTYSIAAKDKNNMPAEVVLPSTYNGKAVTTIGDYAFYYCSSLTEIVIPDSVTSIGYFAFSYCYSLTSVVMPDSVTSIGDGAFRECHSLTSVVMPDSVTSIGNGAFYYCYSLTSVVIPDSVTSIGDSAFESCNKLQYNVKENLKYLGNEENPYLYLAGVTSTGITSASIDQNCRFVGDYAFSECVSLTNVVIPDSVTSLGRWAFDGCSNLTSVVIGDSVTTIGGAAFWGCSSLTSVVIPDSVTSIGDNVFWGCSSLQYKVKNGLKYLGNNDNPYLYLAGAENENITTATIDSNCRWIGSYAFDYCDSLTSVEIPNSVTSIGGEAFAGCGSLTSVEIPNSVTSIGYGAFAYCSSLTSVVIGNSVTSIGEGAFRDCGSLTSVVIGNSVTSIGSSAFVGCYRLVEVVNKSTNITVTKGNTGNGYVGYYALSVSNCDDNYVSKLSNDNGYIVYTDGAEKILVAYIGEQTELVLPTYITQINQYAFRDCGSLTSIEIPNSVTSIGNFAFRGCSSLTSIEIPNSVTSIGNFAFRGCSSLTSVVIGNGVVTIGDDVFSICRNLTSVVIGNSVTSIGYRAFYDCYRLVEVINKSHYITVTKGGVDNGYVGCYALSVSNCDDNYVSKLSNDNGYIVYTDGAEKILVAYIGEQTELVLPTYITQINQYAFYYCSSLTSVDIGDSVISIGVSAFEDCSSLTSVDIGDSVTSIGVSAFLRCENLVSVNYMGTINKWAEISFGNIYANPLCCANELKINGEVVTEVNLTSATKVSNYAFAYCSSLTSVVIGNSVTSIGSYAFYGCSSLTSVVIGNSVTSIGSYAFRDCGSLTSVVIGNSVTSIGDWAFRDCGSLTSIKYRGTQTQWEAISKGYTWAYNTGNYTITYNYTGE